MGSHYEKAMGSVGDEHTRRDDACVRDRVERAREIERYSAQPNFGGKTPTFYWDNLGFSERCHSRVRWLR